MRKENGQAEKYTEVHLLSKRLDPFLVEENNSLVAILLLACLDAKGLKVFSGVTYERVKLLSIIGGRGTSGRCKQLDLQRK